MDRDKLLDRLRKLLALATSPNEHEAALAAAQAQALMHRYQLTLADVERPQYVKHQITTPWWWQADPRRASFVRFLVPLVVNNTGCVTMENLDGSYVVVGDPTLAEGAVLLVDYLFETIEQLARRGWRQRVADLTDPILGRHGVLDEPGAAQRWINGYTYGMIEGLARRIEQTKAETIAEVAEGSGTDLMVVGTALTKQRDQLVAWTEAKGARRLPAVELRSGTMPLGAFRDGLATSEQLPLEAPKGRLDG